MADSNTEEPEKLQNDMFQMLNEHLHIESEDLRKLKSYLGNAEILEPVHLQNTKSAQDVCNALLKKEKISLGNYSFLIEKLRTIDCCPLAKKIFKIQQHIEGVMLSYKAPDTDKSLGTECDVKSGTECDGPYTSTKPTTEQKVHVPVGEHDISLDLLFDFVSSKLSNEMLRLASELDMLDNMDTIKHDNPNNIQEQNFQILYRWKCMTSLSDGEYIQRLNQVLQEIGRQDIVDDIEEFRRQNYRVSGICNSDEAVKDEDINKYVVPNINLRYMSLARFLCVPQNDLEQIQYDKRNNIREQVYDALLRWRRRYPRATRQWLCDGLNYASHPNISKMLNKKWSER